MKHDEFDCFKKKFSSSNNASSWVLLGLIWLKLPRVHFLYKYLAILLNKDMLSKYTPLDWDFNLFRKIYLDNYVRRIYDIIFFSNLTVYLTLVIFNEHTTTKVTYTNLNNYMSWLITDE